MTYEIRDPRLFVAIQEDPQEGSVVYRKRWWVTDSEGNPLFWKSGRDWYAPQCNSREDIVRSIQEKLYPWAEVKYFEIVIGPAT